MCLHGFILDTNYYVEVEWFSGKRSHFLQDDEFGRQVLAEFPLSIERLKVVTKRGMLMTIKLKQ